MNQLNDHKSYTIQTTIRPRINTSTHQMSNDEHQLPLLQPKPRRSTSLSLDALIEKLEIQIAQEKEKQIKPIHFTEWIPPPHEIEASNRFSALYLDVYDPEQSTAILRDDLITAWERTAPCLYRVALGLGKIRFIIVDENLTKEQMENERRKELELNYASRFLSDVQITTSEEQSHNQLYTPLIEEFEVCVLSEYPIIIEQSHQ